MVGRRRETAVAPATVVPARVQATTRGHGGVRVHVVAMLLVGRVPSTGWPTALHVRHSGVLEVFGCSRKRDLWAARHGGLCYSGIGMTSVRSGARQVVSPKIHQEVCRIGPAPVAQHPVVRKSAFHLETHLSFRGLSAQRPLFCRFFVILKKALKCECVEVKSPLRSTTDGIWVKKMEIVCIRPSCRLLGVPHFFAIHIHT